MVVRRAARKAGRTAGRKAESSETYSAGLMVDSRVLQLVGWTAQNLVERWVVDSAFWKVVTMVGY